MCDAVSAEKMAGDKAHMTGAKLSGLVCTVVAVCVLAVCTDNAYLCTATFVLSLCGCVALTNAFKVLYTRCNALNAVVVQQMMNENTTSTMNNERKQVSYVGLGLRGLSIAVLIYSVYNIGQCAVRWISRMNSERCGTGASDSQYVRTGFVLFSGPGYRLGSS